MPLEGGEDGDTDLYDTVYRSLQQPVRRRLLFGLLDYNPRRALLVPEDLHGGEKDVGTLDLELVHHHLPLLEGAGLIRWDRSDDEIHEGAGFDTVRTLIEAIRRNDPLRIED